MKRSPTNLDLWLNSQINESALIVINDSLIVKDNGLFTILILNDLLSAGTDTADGER